MLAVLLLVVLVPTACTLWFLSAAMRNSHLAARQRLMDVYREQAAEARRAVVDAWDRKQGQLRGAPTERPPLAFAVLVGQQVAHSAVIRDEAGRALYPAPATQPATRTAEDDPAWEAARTLEFVESRPVEAAVAYAAMAAGAKGTDRKAAALRAQARCLAKAGDRAGAIGILTGLLAGGELSLAADENGRLIQPAALLFACELMPDADAPAARAVVEALRVRLCRYETPALPAAQRLFLMESLRRIDPNVRLFSLEAERLAAEYLDRDQPPVQAGRLTAANPPRLCHTATEDGRVVAIFDAPTLAAELAREAGFGKLFGGAEAAIVPPTSGAAAGEAFLSVPLDANLPGWQLQVRLGGADPFSAAAGRQNAVYAWTASLGIAAVVLLAVVVAAVVGRQMRLARLKNDLIATVSHELKTPLSSMRVLVDTLLEGRCRDERQAREYHEMIASENERLSRVIDNFLAFSRMERNKAAFERVPVDLADVVAAAVASVRERFARPGCELSVDVAEHLPPALGDRDALITVLVNLLDNAWKYTGEAKRIALRAFDEGGAACLEVSDNGVGMSRREVRRVFDRFYQADRRLARSAGGCGLGLSIVRFIVDAHGGRIDVASTPGEGSTFTVRLSSVGALRA